MPETRIRVLGALSPLRADGNQAVVIRMLSGTPPVLGHTLVAEGREGRWTVLSYGFISPRRRGEWLVCLQAEGNAVELQKGDLLALARG